MRLAAHDFTVGCSAAHNHFLRWLRAGTWTTVLTAIRGQVRTGQVDDAGPRRPWWTHPW